MNRAGGGLAVDPAASPDGAARPPQAPGCRVKILISDFEGGTANHVRLVAERWDPNRSRAEIVCSDPRIGRVRTPLPVTRLRTPSRLDRFPFTQATHLFEIGRLLRRRPADVVHTYFFWPIMYGRILKAMGRIPVLVENREDEGFDWSEREYAMLRATRGCPDRVICVSNAIADLVIRRERLSPDQVEVIHNGISLPEPVPADVVSRVRRRLGLGDDALVVGMVANYERPVKGIAQFLEAVPMILASTPEAHFVVVGRGPESARERATRMGIGDSVHFVGPQEDVDAFYGLMDISVLSSLSEGLSLVLLESMAHGLPVVATRVGGNPEVVEEGVTGYLVPPDDPRSFAEKVVRLLTSPSLRARMGEAGRQRVEQQFSIETVARRYQTLHGSLVQRSRHLC